MQARHITDNPLLDENSLPRFTLIRAEHVRPAIEQILQDNEALISSLLNERNQESPDWNSLMLPLDDAEDRLSKVWSTASHLNAVMNSPEMRAAYNDCQALVTAYYSALGQNHALFKCVQKLQERADVLQLEGSQRKIIKDMLLDFRLAGVALNAEKRVEFTALQTRLSQLSNEFGNNVLDATRAWSRHITVRSELSGLPESTIKLAEMNAQESRLEGYLLTLDFPCYFAVLTHADNTALREEMYRAYHTRASDQDGLGGQWDNRSRIDETLRCRAREAELLGFANYAELSVARKMAGSTERVMAFLHDLIDCSFGAARLEFEELCRYARETHGVSSLQPWDITYYSEKLRQQQFNVSQEEVRAYFPVAQVLRGLFEISHRLFGIRIERRPEVTTWHDSVEFYEISRDGKPVAGFYLDLFTREGKRGGAWMAECNSRRKLGSGKWQIPVAYLVCNFAHPTASSPALLTHNEVTTLFHEFGHGLHHMLTSEQYLRSSGIRGVAWDAVELPSQLLENWCWQPEALNLISAHYRSGEALPAELLSKMLAARNFQAGMKSLRQLEFALFDFAVHTQAGVQLQQTAEGEFVDRVLAATRGKTSLYRTPQFNRFQNAFSHIFAGGYAAGYYSYKWAEVLSADVFSMFSTRGVFHADTGQAFLQKLLSRGGGKDALSLFTDFMGREPDPLSLLRQEGLR